LIGIRSFLDSWTGYGVIAHHLGEELERLGVPVLYEPIRQPDEGYYPVRRFARDRVAGIDRTRPTLHLAPPDIAPFPGRPTVVFSMYETTGLPRAAVEALNSLAPLGVIVPCRQNAEAFRGAGVRAPIRVVPLGIDPAVFFDDGGWPDGKAFTFGGAGRLKHGGSRKGLVELARAFVSAFPNRLTPVRLELKVWPDCELSGRLPPDPRITLNRTPMDPPMIAGWYRGLDCYVTASKGEGWGMQTHEAMACGRPVIAAPWGGTSEFWRDDCGWPLGFDFRPAGEYYAGSGDWIVPREGDLIAAMRAAVESPGEGREKGKRAAVRAAEFDWRRTGRELLDALKRLGLIP
jgi:glycosyltransferase involved in cell wall biosynthesis